jgi:DNA-binding XRE family transcriptional regulator
VSIDTLFIFDTNLQIVFDPIDHNLVKGLAKTLQVIDMNYTQKMKRYRFEHQLKQADIARKLGISQQVYSLIESGNQKPKLDFVLDYKKVTGIDLTKALPPVPSDDLPTISLDELADLFNPLQTIRALRQEISTLQQKIATLEKKLKKRS